MATRRESLVGFLGLAARLGPGVAVALALLCWLPLHVIAVETAQLPAFDVAASAANSAGPARFAHLVAATLQYLMPGSLLIGALLARFGGRREAARGGERAAGVPVGAMLQEDFDDRLEAALRARGFEVLALAGAAPGTADLMVVQGAVRRLVQRAHWQSWQVGDAVVRELAAEVGAQRVDGGLVVTGGWFSREARELAAESGIELVDGDVLASWFGALREPGKRAPKSRPTAPAAAPTAALAPRLAPAAPNAPACPKCGTTMHRQQATRGKMQGQYYWACTRQPKCLGILPCRVEPDRRAYGAALTH